MSRGYDPPMPEPSQRPAGVGVEQRALAAALAAGVSLAVSVPLILTGRVPQRVAFDVLVYHEAAARWFARDWPRLDFKDYLSATTPGFHLLVAAAMRVFGEAHAVGQAVAALIGAALAGTVAWGAAARSWHRAVLLTLPVVFSPYVLQSSAWTLPDNLGWLGVALVLVTALAGWSPARVVLWTILIALLVFTRQMHLWTATAVWAAAWLSIPSTRGEKAPIVIWLSDGWRTRARRLAMSLVVVIPAVLVLAWFARLWGGLTPARFQHQHQGLNWATPPFVLAVLGIFSTFYLPLLWRAISELFSIERGWLLLAVVAGLLAAVLPATTYDMDAGRWSGIWNLTRAAPVLLGRTSLLMVALSCWGAVMFAAWVRSVPRREGLILLAGLVAFAAAQTANHHAWQRYVEPFVAILIALAASRVPSGRTRPERVWWLGPLALIGMLLAVNVGMMRAFPRLEDAKGPDAVPEGGPYRAPYVHPPPAETFPR